MIHVQRLRYKQRNPVRTIFLTVTLLFFVSVSPVFAGIDPFHAGIIRLSVPAEVPFDTLIWYPTESDEVSWQTGPFLIPASHNATFASGRFPIVLLSHGGGLTGGSPLILRELSAELARQGFVVIAPFHGRAGLRARSPQVELALDAVLADPRFKFHVDPKRLGMIGFSLGGAVTLELAGAIPNMDHLTSYCSAHPDDVMSCHDAPGAGGNDSAPQQNLSTDTPRLLSALPLKAIALLDPFAVLFKRDELTAVTIPVLLFRPQQSQLPGDANALGLATALPHAPRMQTIPGRHFIFTDICPPVMKSKAPEVCEDPPGVDRAAVHDGVETQIGKFFSDNL
jgi:predicted dienelactone hydrolase